MSEVYPKIRKLVIEVSQGEKGLTLDDIQKQVNAAYFYAVETRHLYSFPLEVNAPIFHADGGEVGWWEMTLE